jgi:hypothetical protein
MKHNLAEQLEWMQNGYQQDKDPLILLALENLQRM